MDELLAEMERCLQAIHEGDESSSSSTGMEVFYPSKYKSCIRIKGKPLLPPLMTESRRIEMQKYKEAALRKELELERKRLRTSARNEDTVSPYETGSSERDRYLPTENNELDERTDKGRFTANSALTTTSEFDLDTSVDLPDNSHRVIADAATGNQDKERKVIADREMEGVLKDGKPSVLMDSLPSTASSSDVSALNQTVINLSDLPEQSKDDVGHVSSSEIASIPREDNDGTEEASFTGQSIRDNDQENHPEDEGKASALLQQSFSDTESFISFVGEYNKLPTPTPSSSTPEVLESVGPVLEVDITPTNEGGASYVKATEEKRKLLVSNSPEHSPGSLDHSAGIGGTLDTNTSSLGSLGQSCTLPISVTESCNSTLADISERLDTPSVVDEVSLNLKGDQSGEMVSSRDRSGSATDSSIPSTVRRGPIGQEADRCEGNKADGSGMQASDEEGTSPIETKELSSDEMHSSPIRRIRRNSYTLETTSPALLAAKARNEAPEAPLALNLDDKTGSPEEAKKMDLQEDDITRVTSKKDDSSQQEKETEIDEIALVSQLELLEEIRQRLAAEQKQQLEELLKRHTREQWLLEKEMTDVQRKVMKSRAGGGPETNPNQQESSESHETSFSAHIGEELSKSGENSLSGSTVRNADSGVINGSQQAIPRWMSSADGRTGEANEDLSGVPKWLSTDAAASVQDSLERDQSQAGTVFSSHSKTDSIYEYGSTWSSAIQHRKEENRHGNGLNHFSVGWDRKDNPVQGQEAEDDVPSAYFPERLLTTSEPSEVKVERGSGFYLEDGEHGMMEGRRHEVGENSSQPSVPTEGRFDVVSAAAKGFLTRRLMRTIRVQEIVKTIKDSTEFIFKLQMETPIKGGNISAQDMALTGRILNQLRAARFELYDIFHSIPAAQRVSIIQQDRESQEQLRSRKSVAEDDIPSRPLSAATIKAMERRKKAKEVQKKVFGSEVGTKGQQTISQTRPKSAPHSRILKQLQGHEAPSFPTRPVSSAAYRSHRMNNVTRVTSNHSKTSTRGGDADHMRKTVTTVQHNKPQSNVRRVLYPATTVPSKKKITRKQAPSKKPFKP